MGANRLQGTLLHAEQFYRAKDDYRRYKGLRCGKCIGSAHCMEYDAMADEEFKVKQAK